MSGLLVLCHAGPSRMSVESVLRALGHRGADAAGYRVVHGQGRCFEFGHARRNRGRSRPLAAQPVRSNDQRWIVALDGMLFNHDTLRDYLRLRYQPVLKSDSHAETLAEAIAHDGVASTLERLDGSFAFVALDRASGTLYAARDGAGTRPLHCIVDAETIAFGTEVRGLAAHGFDPGEPDPLALATWLRLGYVPAERTLRTRLRQVPAGTLLTWHGGRLGSRSFRYRPVETGSFTDGTDAVTQFGTLLSRALRVSSSGDATGLLLSSGLDSAVLAATLKHQGIDLPCFSVGFAANDRVHGTGHDDDATSSADLQAAADTAQALGLQHRPLVLTAGDLIAAEAAMIEPLEAPLGHPGPLRIAQGLLYRYAGHRVDTLISGQGADDLLGGHRRHRAEALRHRLPLPARGSLRRAAHLLDATGGGQLGHTRRALQVLGQPDWLTAYVEAREIFRPDEIEAFDVGPCPEPARLFASLLRRSQSRLVARSDLNRSLWLDTRVRLADHLLTQEVRLAMTHGLSLRLPYLVAPIIDLVERGPDEWRVTPRESWRLLRALARRVLPADLIGRRRPAGRLPNLFRDPRFLTQSRERVAHLLGTGLGWRIDPLIAVMGRAARGGQFERRAWTLHALARWLETVHATEAHTATMAPRGLGADADITS